MSITLVSPRETELQKQVIELAESLRNLGWEFELYKTGARNVHQKLLDQIRELKSQLAEVPVTTAQNPRVIELYEKGLMKDFKGYHHEPRTN